MNESKRDPSRRPTHPGEILRLDVLPAMGITQGDLADLLGVSRLSVSQLLNGHRGLSATMAVRLERVVGSTADHWLSMQQAVDLWDARRSLEKSSAAEALFTSEATNVVNLASECARRAYTVAERNGISGAIRTEKAAWTMGDVA